MSLSNWIQTLCQCHVCGFRWKLKYSTVKKIILARHNNDLITNDHIHGDAESKAYLCKKCPSCNVDVCVYSDDIDDYSQYIPKRKIKDKIRCFIEGHEFKGNLRHSIYTCKKCNAKIQYKNAKILYLN